MKHLYVAMNTNLFITAKPTQREWAASSASLTLTQSVVAMSKQVAANRVVICPECKKEIEVRSAFAHETLVRHMKEHKK
jgi:hypothetical protein